MTAALRPSLATALREQFGLEVQDGRERCDLSAAVRG
jgi:hypothetical protein